jgi:uncharacterized protein (TIGR03790 family)
MIVPKWLLILVLLTLGVEASGGPGTRRADDLAARVVIVVNGRSPESVRLGRHYAIRRGVSPDHVCEINTTTGETIDRAHFDREIRQPVRRFLRQRRLLVSRGPTTINRAHFLVTVYGVPTRVSARPRAKGEKAPRLRTDRASVDGELALVGHASYKTAGPIPNPYANQKQRFATCLRRAGKSSRLASIASLMCMVSRLDGPNEDVVRRMIDDAVSVERDGLAGKSYFDLRGVRKGPYRLGDQWLARAVDVLTKAGIACQVESTGKLIPPTAPMPEAALYFGWYTGNAYGRFLDPGFRFVRGAVAYHLHSFSATVVRSEAKRWVGPLLARGAAVTMGHVYEPYLRFTTRIDVFADRLLRGWTFAEAGYASIAALSWQNVFLGDPLYRPFAVRPGRAASQPTYRDRLEGLRREVIDAK